MNQPEIAAGRLLLRPWRRSDADAVVRAWADPEIRRWAGFGATFPVRENVEQWVDWNNQQWQFGLRAGFAVCDVADERLAGSIMLRDFGRTVTALGQRGGTGEAGYWITPAERGHGAATTALNALCAWAFSEAEQGGLGLHRIELRHSVLNKASCRVAEKAGFRCEGTMRRSFRYADGEWHDEHLHGRLWNDDAA